MGVPIVLDQLFGFRRTLLEFPCGPNEPFPVARADDEE